MRPALLALATLGGLAPVLAQAQYPIRVPLQENELAVVNPPRVAREYVGINARHKLVVALLGAGVDYNHPLLRDHLHFDVENGQASGLGLDFVGADLWPSYRLFNTWTLGFDRQLPEKRKEIEETSSREKWEEERASEQERFACTTRSLIQRQPGLAVFSPGQRNFIAEEEISNTTGVAGTIAGGRPEIGVIPYRTGPYVKNQREAKDEGLGTRWIEIENVKRAVEHAASRGAKVVFLPNFNFEARPDDTASQVSRNALVNFMRKRSSFAEEYLRLMRSHPEMVFVARVAPQHGWTDDVSLIQYPCGLPATNLVCTGPLNDRDVLEPSYKIPVNEDARLLFTRPSENDVLKPADHCPRLSALVLTFLGSDEESPPALPVGDACTYDKKSGKWSAEAPSRALKAVLDETLASCTGSRNWTGKSDSMYLAELAAGQITRVVAESWLGHPEISKGADLLDLVIEKNARCERAGALKQCLIATNAPDWSAIIKARKPARPAPPPRKLLP